MLGSKYMDSVGVTNTNSYVYYGLNPNLTNWFSVRSLGATNARGERAYAIEKPLGTSNCPIAVDVDLSGLTPVDNAQMLDCMVGGNMDVNISIKNEGLNVLSNIPVHYQLNGGAAVNEIYPGPLNPGATYNHVFSSPISPIPGTNTLLVWSDMSGDGNYYNDSVTSQFNYMLSTVQTLPWSEDFETFSLCGTASDCEAENCMLTNDFTNSTNTIIDDIDWRTDQGGTPSNGTGPTQDYNPGTSTGNYLYLEASNGCEGQTAEMISPCIDLTAANSPQLDFAYSMNGADMGTLFIDIYSNGSWTNNVTIINGDKGPNWFIKTVYLPNYVGSVINIRFRGVTGSGWESDLAIDDINVTDAVGIDDANLLNTFNLHPNPSKGIFNYEYNGTNDAIVKVIAVSGKVVFQKQLKSTQNGVIDISDYAKGLYILSIINEDTVITKKLIKE
jgi:hypothetical protein